MSEQEKNILYLLPVPKFFSYFGGIGGHIAHADGILKGLYKNGYSPIVVAEENHSLLKNYEVFTVGSRSRNMLVRQYWSLKYLNYIKQYLNKWDPEFCYIRYSVGFGLWFNRLNKILGDIPLILEVNSIGSQRSKVFKYVELWAMKSADLIICISEKLKKFIVENISSELEEKIIVIPNGVDMNRINHDFDNNADDEITFGYVGQINKSNGVETLLEAFVNIDVSKEKYNLKIIGDGSERKKLEHKYDDKDIKFLGKIPYLDVPEYMKDVDILIYTTTKNHTFQSPIKLYEYMSSGKAIIAAETPQTRKILSGGKRGLLYEVEDPKMLKKQMIKLAEDRSLRYQISNKAEKSARKHSWENRVKSILEEMERRNLI